jgi:hypothetical protein
MDEEGEVDEWNIAIDVKERKTEGPRRGPDVIDLVKSEHIMRESYSMNHAPPDQR